jgi:lipooligosaccharide transport system ATP-binding protein
VVPQEDNLDEELNVEQNLGVFARLYGIATGPARSRIRELLDFMELGDKAKARIRELSGGMKRRLVIARALLNEPEFLILDEPTTGLDPQVRHAIWEKLRQLRRGGLTILLSTHYLEEAFQLCDEALILDKGKAILRGHPKELLEQHVEPYVLELMDGSVSSEVLARLSADAVRVERSAETTRIYGRDYRELMSATSALRPDQFHLRQSTLEDVFLKTTGRALNESQ